jgi:hypothetical protein
LRFKQEGGPTSSGWMRHDNASYEKEGNLRAGAK